MRILQTAGDAARSLPPARRDSLRSKNRKGFSALALVCLFVFFAGTAVPFFVPVFFGFAWNGYYTVLVDGKADIREISSALGSRGIEGFLSAANSSVEFSDFDAGEKIPVCELPAKLLPEDPRMDDFLKGVPALFRSASGKQHVVYFPAEESSFTFAWKLKKALEGYAWTLVEWQTAGRIILFLLFCLAAGLCAYFSPGLRFAAVALALPWLNFLAHGDPGVFAAGILVYFALMHPAEEASSRLDHYLYGEGGVFWTRSLRLRVFASAFLVCGAAVLAFLSGGLVSLVPLAGGLAGSFALAVLLACRRRRRRTNSEHRLFVPVAILPRGWKPGFRRGAGMVPFVFIVCLLAVPLVFRHSGSFSEAIPRPRPVPGITGFSRESLRQLWAEERGGLPDFSDYLCHRAFQESFLYGYPQEFPLPGSRVSLPRYSEEKGVVRRTEDTLLTFDEIWYKKELEKAEEAGVGNLLLRQGVSEIAFEPASRISVDRSWTLRYALVVAASLLPFLLASASGFFRRAAREKTFVYRRNQQGA